MRLVDPFCSWYILGLHVVYDLRFLWPLWIEGSHARGDSRGYCLVMVCLYFSLCFFTEYFPWNIVKGLFTKQTVFCIMAFSWASTTRSTIIDMMLRWSWGYNMLHKAPRWHKTVCKWCKFQCQALYKEEICPLPASKLWRIGDRSCWGAMLRHATEKETDLRSFSLFQCLQDVQGFSLMNVMQTLVCLSVCHDLSAVSRSGTK